MVPAMERPDPVPQIRARPPLFNLPVLMASYKAHGIEEAIVFPVLSKIQETNEKLISFVLVCPYFLINPN